MLGFVFAGFLLKPFGFLVDPVRVVAFVRDAIAAVQLKDPAGDVVQEVAVVGHDQDRAFVVDQVLLQPCDGFGVQVVGRFIEQQHFGRFKQQFAKGNTTGFTPGKGCYIRIIRRAAQCFHRYVDLAVEIPQVLGVDLVLQRSHLVGGFVGIVHRQFVIAVKYVLFLFDAKHDIFTHGQSGVEIGFLLEVANLGPLCDPRLARKVFVLTGHDPHQSGFTRTVDTDDADFHTGKEVQVNVVETFLAARIGL